eukprot:3205012-Pyramimonas_sp.AAC.1
MASLYDKMGDAKTARSHRMAAQALQAPRPASFGARIQQAHADARQVENKFEGAVLKFETMEQQ